MARTITKTAVAAGLACELQGYRRLVRQEWGGRVADEDSPQLAAYRMRDHAIAEAHRIRLRGGVVARGQLPALLQSAWERGGGSGPADPAATDWLAGYLDTDPFLRDRRLLAVEATLTSARGARRWSARPDALALAGEGLDALELTGARHPLLDERAVRTMAALDQLAMRGEDLPHRYRRLPHRVFVCSLQDMTMHEVTLPRAEVRSVLDNITWWLEDLGARYPRGEVRASPSKEGCARCPFPDCPERWGGAGPPRAPRAASPWGGA